MGALGKMSLEEIISAIKRTLDTDDKNVCKLTTIWGDATFQVKAMSEPIADKIMKGLDISKPNDQGDSQYNRLAAVNNAPSVPFGKCPLLIDFNESTLVDHTKENLIKALSFALQNPAFADAFNKANAGLLDKLNAMAAGDNEIKNLPPADAIDGSTLDDMAENGKSAAAMIKQLIAEGKITDDIGAGINSGVLGALDVIADKDKTDTENEALNIVDDGKGSNLDKLTNLADMSSIPAAVAEAFASFLQSLSDTDLANALLGAAANDPSLAANVNDSNALNTLGLSTEQMKQFLLAGADNDNHLVSAAVANSSVKAVDLEDAEAKSLADGLATDPNQPENVSTALGSEMTNTEKLDEIANGPVKPEMPDEAKEATKDIIEGMTDEEILNAFNLASSDPDFAAFLKALLADELADEKNKNGAVPNDADAAALLGMSPEEMRKALKNANEMFLAFASGDQRLAGGILEDGEAKTTLKNLSAVGDLLTDAAEKDELSAILNGPISDQDKVSQIADNDSFSEANKDGLTSTINNLVLNVMSDPSIVELFGLVCNDPYLLDLLKQANPDLMARMACIQNPAGCVDLL